MTSHVTKHKEQDLSKEDTGEMNFLVLHNDDFHTFDFVINTLMEVCGHDYEQAVQCTYFVHYKGKCDVKRGSFDLLKPLKDALIQRELTATID